VTVIIEGNGRAWPSPSSGKTGDRIVLYFEELGDDTFEHWEVISGDVTIENNSFVLGTSNVVIKAIFTGSSPEPSRTYKITVIANGKGIAFSLPSVAEEGETVTIFASTLHNSKFSYWSGNAKIPDTKKSPTTFTMPAHDVTIYAWFKKRSSICYMLRPSYIRR